MIEEADNRGAGQTATRDRADTLLFRNIETHSPINLFEGPVLQA